MKKHGFTLAEVLVTLGIIGVVSALVMPTFVTNVSGRTVGPKLFKAASSFQNAADALRVNLEVTDLAAASSVVASGNAFFENLGHYMRGSYDSSTGVFTGNDGVTYWFGKPDLSTTTVTYPHEVDLLLGGVNDLKPALLVIDINGNASPNGIGKDRFYFHLMHDGSLRPFGGTYDGSYLWTKVCAKDTTPTDVKHMAACTAHIFNNDGKVGYNISGMETLSKWGVSPGGQQPYNPVVNDEL